MQLVLVYSESFRSEFNPLTNSAAFNNTLQFKFFHLLFNLGNTLSVRGAGIITLHEVVEIIFFHQVLNNCAQFIGGKLMPTVHIFDQDCSDGFDAGGNARHWNFPEDLLTIHQTRPLCANSGHLTKWHTTG